MSRLIAHGNRDEVHSGAELFSYLTDRPWLILTCGHARDVLASALLALSPQYELRRVDTTVPPGTANGFDDGHSVLEVRGGAFNTWTLVDIDQGLLFRTAGDAFLDTAGFVAALGRRETIRYEVLSPKEIDLHFIGKSAPHDGYNFAVYEQQIMRYPQTRDGWYGRVLQLAQYQPVVRP